MNAKLKSFIEGNRTMLLTLGLILFFGGILLAYLTGDAEPWGTIGGFCSAIGLMVALLAQFGKWDNERN